MRCTTDKEEGACPDVNSGAVDKDFDDWETCPMYDHYKRELGLTIGKGLYLNVMV